MIATCINGRRLNKKMILREKTKYDIAVILELPGHLMIRKSKSHKWPSPGNPLFGVPVGSHFRVSAKTPAFSCRKTRLYLYDYFGTKIYLDKNSLTLPEKLMNKDSSNGTKYGHFFIHIHVINNIFSEADQDDSNYFFVGMLAADMAREEIAQHDARLAIREFIKGTRVHHDKIGFRDIDEEIWVNW
jgi:hypothetical protein